MCKNTIYKSFNNKKHWLTLIITMTTSLSTMGMAATETLTVGSSTWLNDQGDTLNWVSIVEYEPDFHDADLIHIACDNDLPDNLVTYELTNVTFQNRPEASALE